MLYLCLAFGTFRLSFRCWYANFEYSNAAMIRVVSLLSGLHIIICLFPMRFQRTHHSPHVKFGLMPATYKDRKVNNILLYVCIVILYVKAFSVLLALLALFFVRMRHTFRPCQGFSVAIYICRCSCVRTSGTCTLL